MMQSHYVLIDAFAGMYGFITVCVAKIDGPIRYSVARRFR